MTIRGIETNPRRSSSTLTWALVLLTLASGASAARRPSKKAAKAAPKPPAAAPATTPPATPATPAAPAVPGLRVEDAKGVATLQFSLDGKSKLGGFELTLTWDPSKFVVAEPKSDAALQGYMCQANVAVAGSLRYNCAGLPNEERGGVLSTVEVHYRDRAPTVADFKVEHDTVVDDMGNKVTDKRVELRIVPKG
jgi:hypothetical protein